MKRHLAFLVCLMVSASAFKPSTPSPYQRDLSRGIRKHNRDDGPEASADDDFTHDHGMVVVVVNEKCTKFYHGLMRPPITSQAPTSTYVHPADPWRMKTQVCAAHVWMKGGSSEEGHWAQQSFRLHTQISKHVHVN